MHLVLTHTDFPLYWIPRIRVLNRALRKKGDQLTVLSVTSKSSTYNFAEITSFSNSDIRWINLFKDKDIYSIPSKHIAAAVFQKLEVVKPDIVIAISIVFPPGAVAVRWSKMRKRPIIVIDGGSTDGSAEIIKRYEKYLSYWVSEPDGGQAGAINRGFMKSTGDLVT